MTDDERAARIWVEHASISLDPKIKKLGHTLQRLLDRPVMPRGSEVPNEVLNEMLHEFHFGMGMRAAIDALHAHLTAPPAPRHRKVETWAAVSDTGVILLQSQDRAKIEEAAGRLHYRIVKLVEAADADQ